MCQSYENKKNFPKIASHKKAVNPYAFLLVFIWLHMTWDQRYCLWLQFPLPVFLEKLFFFDVLVHFVTDYKEPPPTVPSSPPEPTFEFLKLFFAKNGAMCLLFASAAAQIYLWNNIFAEFGRF